MMMLRALYTGATGANAQQVQLDIIAHNLANVNTNGYKKVRTEFQDLISQNFSAPGTISAQGTTKPVGVQIGLGTRVAATQRMFLPGSVVQTGNKLDLAIQGEGFFQVLTDNGDIAYSRDGAFKRDSAGTLVTSDGYPLEPAVNIPQDTVEISINLNGTISIKQAGAQAFTEIGQVQLARFANPTGLESIGNNLFMATPASGDAINGTAGQGDFGRTSINQGYIENSNVQIVEEMINMITAQRAFETNTSVIKAGDQILQNMTNIGR
ncbi:MAG: flagellar basal-body rod protein FlgG [Vampirovibrionales bacterium]